MNGGGSKVYLISVVKLNHCFVSCRVDLEDGVWWSVVG